MLELLKSLLDSWNVRFVIYTLSVYLCGVLSALLVLLLVKLCRSSRASSPSPSQTVSSSLPTTTDVSFAVSGATFTTSTFEPAQASKFASVRSVDQVIVIDNQRVHKV